MAWTTAQDVLDSWIGEGAPADVQKINLWIGRAERLIRRHPGLNLAVRLAAGEPDLQETLVDVVTDMVTKKFENPRGIRQTNTTTGPYTNSQTFGGDEPGSLALSDEHVRQLLPGSNVSGQAFSIDLIPSTSMFAERPLLPVVSEQI